MNAQQRQYLFGFVFLGFACYQFKQDQMLEFALYGLAGLSFIVNQLASEPKLAAQKKILVALTWLLIIATGLTFFYLLQFKFL